MTINLRTPETADLAPRITVLGVGGAGGNAVNNMINSRLEGVSFVVANTDAQALAQSKAEHKIQLGAKLTEGLGAGAKPEVGRGAAEESIEQILEQLSGSHMVFITAGMGGGTGTGAAPVIARAVRELGVLTVGVVTKPFHFEGDKRMRAAERGIEELQAYVDTLIVIPNQNLFRVATERTTFAQAFAMADDVLHSGVRGVTDLIVMPGLINRDFADIKTVMSEMGKAMMGTGEMEGEGRALKAAEAAISNPLLDDVSMRGARAVLVNVTGGLDLMLFEVDEAVNRIRAEVDGDANILFGSALSEDMEGRVRVSVVATGIDAESMIKGAGDNVKRLHPRLKPVTLDTPPRAVAETIAASPVHVQMETIAQGFEPAAETSAHVAVSMTTSGGAQFAPLDAEPLTLGGDDTPMIEAARLGDMRPMEGSQADMRSMREAPRGRQSEPEKKRFGLFGSRRRPAERVEPPMEQPRKQPAAAPLSTPAAAAMPAQIAQPQQPAMVTRQIAVTPAAQTAKPAAAGAQAAQPGPNDLFAGVAEDSRFEIPAFLRRKANTGT